MDFDNCNGQAREKKLSEQFVAFIDLTDEDLEEVNVLELGGSGGRSGVSTCSSCIVACGCGRRRGTCSNCGRSGGGSSSRRDSGRRGGST
jgi:hypothetical protein